jgi:hypothetical protein
MEGGLNMLESTNITLPKSMSITKRISEANKRISEWIMSLEVPFDFEKDDIRLKKCERDNDKFSYHYTIARGVNITTRKR